MRLGKMHLDYEIKPVLVKKIIMITHKGKKRDFKPSLHTHRRVNHEMPYCREVMASYLTELIVCFLR